MAADRAGGSLTASIADERRRAERFAPVGASAAAAR
jgi:hypothetical protein